jgi:signal transduction histidine kinase
MDAIEEDVRRASDVIDRIRSAVRQQKPRLDVLDINTLISDVVKLVSEDATARRVEILTSLSGECPRVAGDRTQIIQVLLNLIANGMDAMAAVPPALRQLTLRTAEREGSVVITVSDLGCGISEEATPHLFEPFFTTRTEGTGLGLSIAHSIVAAHQGRMWAENNTKSGAAFYFSLPTRQSGQ